MVFCYRTELLLFGVSFQPKHRQRYGIPACLDTGTIIQHQGLVNNWKKNSGFFVLFLFLFVSSVVSCHCWVTF